MKRIILFLSVFVIILLASCTPSEGAIQTAMAQTQAAIPTETIIPTATPIPFSELQLDDLIIQSYDLPAGVIGSQIGNKEEPSDLQLADYYIQQVLSFNNSQRGKTQVWVYEDNEITSLRYEYEVNLLKLECEKSEGRQCDPKGVFTVSDIGEAAQYIILKNFSGYNVPFLVFRRCNGVVRVSFVPFSDGTEETFTYVQRLDKRLTPIVCR